MKTKNVIILSCLFVALLSLAAVQVADLCDATALKAELKRELRPDYRYDSSKTSRFKYISKTQVKEIEVPLFMGEKYRFLFNTKGLPKDITIEIYNKPNGNSKRKLLYQLEQKEDQFIYAFEPEKSRKMYINYTIPAHVNSELNGCVIFVLGYKLAILKGLN